MESPPIAETSNESQEFLYASATQPGIARSNITLITGQTVRVIKQGNKTQYAVDSDEPMYKINLSTGTYIFPASVDFGTFDKELFNIDLLLKQGLADPQSDKIPIVVTGAGELRPSENSGQVTTSMQQRLTTVEGYQSWGSLSSVDGYSGSLSKSSTNKTANLLSSMDRVDKIYLDKTVQVSLDDSLDAAQASPTTLPSNVSGTNVSVAVIDTGIDTAHPDLDGSTVKMGRDFTSDGTTDDLFGHGTHAAGIIAGDGDASNGTYRGVAPNASIINAKALNKNGRGRISQVISAMEFSVNQNADVISMSLGSPVKESDLLAETANWATDKGTVVVAASGNRGSQGYFTTRSPGVAREAITVGAVDGQTDTVPGFSSRGPTPRTAIAKPNLVAPGVGIISARASGTSLGTPVTPHYTSATGTSMAAPHVSGAAALILDAYPDRNPKQVKSALVTTTDSLSNSGSVYTGGTGQLNVSRAISPGLTVTPGALQFGLLNDTSETKVLRITNQRNDTQHIQYNVTATDVISGNKGKVAVNQTKSVLNGSQTTAVTVSVNASGVAGIYSGRLYINSNKSDQPYSVGFGYVRRHTLTVTKQALDDTGVDNNPVVLVPHGYDNQRFYGDKIKRISGNSTSFFTFEGNYSIWSSSRSLPANGTGENKGVVMTAETVSVSSDRSVVLDETETVVYQPNDSELINRHEQLSNLSIQTDLHRDFRHPDGSVNSYELSLINLFAQTRTVRLPQGQHSAKIEYLLVPRQYHMNTYKEGRHLDSPVGYHLAYTIKNVESSKNIGINITRLAVVNRTYRTDPAGSSYFIRQYAHQESGSDIAYGWRISQPPQQTMYITPNMNYDYEIRSFGAVPIWELSTINSLNSPENTTNNVSINRHPYMGLINYWDLFAGGVTLQGIAQVDQGPEHLMYKNQGVEPTTRIFRNGSVVKNISGTEFAYSDLISNNAGTHIRVVTNADNPGRTLSTQIVSEWGATYYPNKDTTPPRIDSIHLADLNKTNTVPAGATRVWIEIEENNAVEKVQIYTGSGQPSGSLLSKTHIESHSNWSVINATRHSGQIFVATINSNPGERPHIAVAVEDEAGNYARTLSYHGFQAAQTPTAQPVPNATLVTETNNVGAPLKVKATLNHTQNLSSLALLHPNGTVLSTTECSDSTCSASFSVVPTQHSWKDTDYVSQSYQVRAVDAANNSATSTVSSPIYITGDANGDGVVDIRDAVLVGNHWRCNVTDPCYSNAGDLNNDGSINIFDTVAVGQNWLDAAST